MATLNEDAKPMEERTDRWILPITGHVVRRCCIDEALTIELSAGDDAATLLIAGPFELRPADKIWRPELGVISIKLAPAQALFGLTVERAEAYKDGTLDMAFADGSRLLVRPDAKYEAWEFTGRHGAKAISMPGGDLAVWRPAA